MFKEVFMTPEKPILPSMEEDIEFSNVTNLRDSFLGVIEVLQKTPAKRFVITKHGKPQAVLMSYQTYSLISKVVNESLSRTADETKREAIAAEQARRATRDFSLGIPAEADWMDLQGNPVAVHRCILDTLRRINSSTDLLYGLLDQRAKEESDKR
jgi:prevent-host-death family protein